MADYTKQTLKGQDYALQMNVGTDETPDFRTIICTTDGTLNLSRASIDAANNCNPSATVSGQPSGTKDFTVQDLVNVTDNTLLSNKDMYKVYESGDDKQWRLLPVTPSVGSERYTFHGSITTHNKTTTTNTIVTTANTITLSDTPVLETNTGTADAPVWTVYDPTYS